MSEGLGGLARCSKRRSRAHDAPVQGREQKGEKRKRKKEKRK